ncbi:transposase, partial [Clostridium botulinum C]|nr:transposase [Clostridium botulinum C]MCD3205631.1 transposase [Clostridium botulinum C]
DIGTRTIAVSSENDVKLLELAPEIDNIENQKRILNRKLDRQRRANNPNKYNEDGTIKKGNRDRWINSNNYLKTKAKLRDIQSRLASIRKQDHEKMANYILSLGSIIKVETMNYKGLQARAKETTINEKTGRFNKKKRFGKSLANKAPSMLLDIINRKLKYHNLGLFKIDTYKIKASQYNPFTNEYIKKSLSERWNRFKINEQEIQIQRDLMSALIIKNVIIDKKLKLDKVNKEKLLDEFDSFKKLHDIEILRLKNCKNRLLNSMGI